MSTSVYIELASDVKKCAQEASRVRFGVDCLDQRSSSN
jgi:hypothetical protein